MIRADMLELSYVAGLPKRRIVALQTAEEQHQSQACPSLLQIAKACKTLKADTRVLYAVHARAMGKQISIK